MSTRETACRKFQANIFNKSKCQNCFKPREVHLLSDEDLNQAKPVYGGWLLLAPEGTNFDNPMHRSRKWQRRFFILYEHGLLRYALDEMPSTLAQGTINMNQCSDVMDGENRTGQKYSLCIITPDKESYIRAESKDIINGWQEALIVYPRTNKQNQKKKRKVEAPTPQEPGPAKVAVTSSSSVGGLGSAPCLPSSIAQAERMPPSRASLWQEERWNRQTPPAISTSRSASCLSEGAASLGSSGRKVRVESGYFSLEKPKPELSSPEPSCAPPLQPLSLTSRYYTFPDLHAATSPVSPTSPPPLASPPPSLSAHLSSSESSLDSVPIWGCSSAEDAVTAGASGSGGGSSGRSGRSRADYAMLADVPRARRLSHREAFRCERKRQELRARTRSPGREEVTRLFGNERRRSQVIERFEPHEAQAVEHMETASSSVNPVHTPTSPVTTNQRQGRSDRRNLIQKQDMSLDTGRERPMLDMSTSSIGNLRRAKSLDRRVTESSMTPDLLNFKKGWMTKLYEDGLWKKHWFVLTDQSLRYYRDSIAEEAADLDGEIDLSSCHDVTEYPVQRNYGFQIHSKEGVVTLSAMTSGIRRNWIQAIMKNVRPTVGPDVTRSSLAEERAKVKVAPDLTSQPTLNPATSSQSSENKGHQSCDLTNTPVAPEQSRSRVRDRRREGRSKTFDWAEFQQTQERDVPDRPSEYGQVEAAHISSSSSSSSSSSTSSSTSSSPASTPMSSPQTSSSLSAPPNRKSTLDRQEEQQMMNQQKVRTQVPQTPSSSTPVATHKAQEAGREMEQMEINHGGSPRDPLHKSHSVQVEIEQRWHQVETTPLREEKQVPIASPSGPGITPPSSGDRLPPQEKAVLLDKELGHTQKELARLQEQNSLLREQLHDARGREQSAREGYVLQNPTPTQLTGSPSPSSGAHWRPWQHLHIANQDLQSELESQRRKHKMASQQVQCLRRSYSEAQDVLEKHEVEIQALQAKLSAAMAEIVESEQAVARMRSELKLEQTCCREREEESGRSEEALRAQLRESEEQLRDVEARLLERNQALRQLEQQQALQKDLQKEVLRLQERLTEVTGRLIATEEAQTLREQRERKEKRSLEENQERERQALTRRLAESEERRSEVEEQLQEAQQQVEALLRGGQDYVGGSVEEVQCLQKQLSVQSDMVETLRENVRMLEEERDRLTCHCQELLNQIAEADREVSKLQGRLKSEETDYCTLESSFEKVSQEFQRISCILKEKEEEVQQTKKTYQHLVERKEQELSEAVIKMAALGSSLEETELRLQEKEEQLCQRGHGTCGEPCQAEKELQAKLVIAEDRIAELERHLDALRLGYVDLRKERRRHSQEDLLDITDREGCDESMSVSSSSLTLTRCSSDTDTSLVKRQRIRFSSIQCQKYLPSDGGFEHTQANTSSDLTHSDNSDTMDQTDLSFTSTNRSFQCNSDPEKFISIIQALEMKLLATEEKLRELTEKLQDQQDHSERKEQPEGALLNPWASPEHLHFCSQSEEPRISNPDSDCQVTPGVPNRYYECALVCLESCREKVRVILGFQQGKESVELQLHNLLEIETELIQATKFMKNAGISWEEPNSSVDVRSMHDLSDEAVVKFFAQSLALEADVLEKIAFSLQNLNSDLVQSLNEISKEIDKIKQMNQSYTMTTCANMLTQKLASELTFWAEMEKLESHASGVSHNTCLDIKSLETSCLGQPLINSACVKFELAYLLQILRSSDQNRLAGLQEVAVRAGLELQQRARALQKLLRSSGLQSAIPTKELDICDDPTNADRTLPELLPYLEQIEMEEALEAAEEIVDRHLAVEITFSGEDSVESSHEGKERLAAELQKQACIIRHLIQDLETLSGDTGSRLHDLAETIRGCWGCRYTKMSVGAVCMREALIQAQVAYTACKLRGEHQKELELCQQAGRSMEALVREHALNMAAINQKYHDSLQEERRTYAQTVTSLQQENQALRGEVSRRLQELQAQQEQLLQLEQEFQGKTEELCRRQQEELLQEEQRRAQREMALLERTEESQRRLECLLQEVEGLEERHEEHVQKLHKEFQDKIQQLQQHHQQEILRLQEQYRRGSQGEEKQRQREAVAEVSSSMREGEAPEERLGRDSMMLLRGRVLELESKMDSMREELESKQLEGDVAGLKDKYQRDFDNLKATCERGFAAMEETHQKVIEDLQRQHQREISKLLEERERLLAEETAATIAAIEAMKNAHREELEKTHRSQLSGVSTDIDELRMQYEEELQSIHRELEVLSEQYSQKCLENAHLAQALQAERQALQQCQRENQELQTHNQELNNRLTEEIMRMRSSFSGESATSPLTQGKDLYELEVLLRIKESEIQYLKQEISSLKDELQTALRDKKYASDKYKGIYTELSIVKAKADCDISKLREKLLAATEALGERAADGSAVAPGYDIMKSKSNPDFLKNERARQSRGVRSKSLKEGLTVQERMKLFEAKDSRKI